MTRIATSTLQNKLMSHIERQTQRVAVLQDQIATGKQARLYSDLGDNAPLQLGLKQVRDRLGQYVLNGDMVEKRLTHTGKALNNIYDVAVHMEQQLLIAMNANNGDLGAVSASATNAIQQVASALNTQFGGLYLFGGKVGDRPPVESSPMTLFDPPADGGPPLYYRGTADRMTARLDDQVSLQYGVTADRQAFAGFFKAMRLVQGGANDRAQLDQALTELKAAMDDMNSASAEIGLQMRFTEDNLARQKEVELVIAIDLGEVESVDFAAAMSELTQRQSMLEASYMLVQRMEQLSLLDVIK